jgi:hypothetical protein
VEFGQVDSVRLWSSVRRAPRFGGFIMAKTVKKKAAKKPAAKKTAKKPAAKKTVKKKAKK